MTRLRYALLIAVGAATLPIIVATQSNYEVSERSIAELAAAMAAGRVSWRALTEAYLARIDAYDRRGPALNAMIAVNPHAADDAAALDRERASRGPRGPLHGIPIVVKDNYETVDLPTTASSVALKGL